MPTSVGPSPRIGNKINYRHVIWRNHGFHADPNLMALVDLIIHSSNIRVFIETGTESGSTLGYIARTYPDIECFSCEADKRIYQIAKQNLANHPNVTIKNKKSVRFLRELKPHLVPNLFWLDAHSHGYGCSLPEELSIILAKWESGYIFIDDFKVPDNPAFGYDEYEFEKGEITTLDQSYIEPAIRESGRVDEISLQYPNYQPVYKGRGWVLITFGNATVVVGEAE